MMIDENSNLLYKLISEKNKYNGQLEEEGMTFLDIVKRKREREEKEEKDKELAVVREREKE